MDINSIMDNNKKWYDEYDKASGPFTHSKSHLEVLNLKEEAKRYLEADATGFQSKQLKSRNSETAWLRTALTQGTIQDKVAAGIVLVQDNPKFNLSRLTFLINQVKTSKHNQCSMIITSLRDLFLDSLLHPSYKLLKFEEQNLDTISEKSDSDSIIRIDPSKKKLLAHWYFEDQLYEHYERFVVSLGLIASDTVDTNRETAISVMTDLLIGNSEQEDKLLDLIINKVGDPNSKVGSKAIFCLNKLLHEHPNMKVIVLREIEKLLFRKNVSQRAQYYAICLLTQFLLSKEDSEIAANLIEVYFAFFKACLKRGEPDSRMMAAILTGVNRAYPFAQIQSNVLQSHIDSVYKVVHVGSFNVSLNALSLLHQISGKDENQANRFYSAFYRKLLDPEIGVANKRAIFLNLVYRVLQSDHSIQRLYAFIKRILQVALYFPANMICATLYVVSKVLQTHKGLKNLLFDTKDCIKVKDDLDDEKSSNSESENSDDEKDDEAKDSIMLTNIVIADPTKLNIKSGKEKIVDTKLEVNKHGKYDPFCRNPLFAGVQTTLNTELLTLSKHYHPSVALFANTILEGKTVDYTGDPLEDLTLMRFLDRYVYKNPKKLEDKKVQRKNDPLAKRAGYVPKGIRRIPVDSASYLNEREERIPVDELYLYHYLKRSRGSKPVSSADDDDMESVNSEEFNDIMDKLGNANDFDELDIAADIQTGKKNKKDIEENDDELEDNESDHSEASVKSDDSDAEQLSGENSDDEFQNLSDIDMDGIEDEDLSDIDFNGDSNDEEETSFNTKNLNGKIKHMKGKSQNKKNVKGSGKDIDNNIFVSAEKFAEMLEEQSRQKNKHGGTDTFSNIDGASSKQIDWEMKRHQKLTAPFHKKKKRKGQQSSMKNNKKIKY